MPDPRPDPDAVLLADAPRFLGDPDPRHHAGARDVINEAVEVATVVAWCA
jgi:hypothetical protein